MDIESYKLILKRIITVASLKVQNGLNICILSKLQLDTIKRFNTLIENHFKDKNKLNNYMIFFHKPPSRFTQLIHQFFSEPLLQIKKSKLVLELKKLLSHNAKKTVAENSKTDRIKYNYSNAFSNNGNIRPNIFTQHLSPMNNVDPNYD